MTEEQYKKHVAERQLQMKEKILKDKIEKEFVSLGQKVEKIYLNIIDYSGDDNFISSLQKQYKDKNWLSEKQLFYAYKFFNTRRNRF